MKKFLVFIAIFISYCIVNTNAATSCYSCMGCTEPFDFTGNSSCVAGDTCMKISLRYISGAFIMKQCVPSVSCKSLAYGIANAGFWMDCCNTDLCNSATKKRFSIATLLFVFSLFFNNF